MHDHPEPTEEEHEQAPERLEEEEAKRSQGFENPEPHEREDDEE
jgi:hypothetical protein